MRLTTKRRVERLETSTVHNGEFTRLENFVLDEVVDRHNKLVDDYIRLKRHISNNGLWGMVKKLRAEFDELRHHTAVMVTEHDRKFRELETNGVATAINRLNEQVFGQSVAQGSNIERALLAMNGVEPRQEASLAAKVDAIIEHLGIEVNVEPEKVVKTPAKIVAKKIKKTKKGKK